MALTKTSRTTVLAGFLFLAGIVIVLFALGFFEALQAFVPASIFIALVLVGLWFGIFTEGRILLVEKKLASTIDMRTAYEALAVLGGALATYFLSKTLGYGAVLASGLVGLLGAILLNSYAVPIFCGSFVGMASPAAYDSYSCILIAGTIAGIVFGFGKGVFDGFGGKLGTTAFLGCLGTSLIRGITLQSSPIPTSDIAVLVIVYSVAGAVLAYAISIRLGKGPVVGSACVGILAAILLPSLYGADPGKMLAVVVFCASFVGMSAKARLSSELQIALAGIICGVLYIYTSPWLGGAGGKLGTLAFGSSISIWGLMGVWRRLSRKRTA
jgi:hypothetical protein